MDPTWYRNWFKWYFCAVHGDRTWPLEGRGWQVAFGMAGAQFTYERVYAWLRERIQSGEYTVGSKLPAERLLAADLGVSRNTVRLALRKLREDGIVAPEQGSGVYVQALPAKERPVRTVGVLIPDVLTPIHQQFLNAFTGLAQAAGVVTALAVHRDVDDGATGALSNLLKLRPDFVILELSRNLTVPLFDELDAAGVPRLLLIRDHPDKLCDKVVVDNVQVGKAATQLLLDYGCTAPVFVGPLDYLTAWDRLCGYRQALTEAGMPFRAQRVLDASRSGKPPAQKGADLIEGLIEDGHPFDGVVAFNDTFACMIIDRLRKRGRSVPGDVAVVGVDDLPCAREGDTPVTTITFDAAGAARHALELIERRLEGREIYPAKRTIEIRVAGRASCPVRTDVAQSAKG